MKRIPAFVTEMTHETGLILLLRSCVPVNITGLVHGWETFEVALCLLLHWLVDV